MRRILVAATLVLVGVRGVWAETFQFDLTSYVGPEFSTGPEATVDLGVQFSEINAARFLISGKFTPGTARLFGDDSNPTFPFSNTNLILRFGEPNTPSYLKPVGAVQELSGSSGQVNFSVPVFGVSTDPLGLLLFMPALVPPADLSSLLDGRLGLVAYGTTYSALVDQVLESPQFELSKLTLEVDATAVPEPASAALFVLAAAMSALALRGRRPRNEAI
jgi:hypothetical protein